MKMVKDKNYYKNVFTPLSSNIRKKKFIGFDIETCEHNSEHIFYFGSLYYNNGYVDVIFSKQEFIKSLLTLKNVGYYITATNLSFDFSPIFYNTPEWNNFNFIYRGSDLLLCSYTYYDNSHNKKRKINFIDTLNYASMGVKELGKIIGIPKLYPLNTWEKENQGHWKNYSILYYITLEIVRSQKSSWTFFNRE
ncbi:MAG: hypothetical protein ACOCZ5_01165 [bacterium]